jgi:alpha-beta hydrolase superfamily lysophospholipase
VAVSLAIVFIALTLAAVWLGYMHPASLLAALALIVSSGLILAYFAARPVLHPRRSQPRFTPADLGIEHWEEVRFSATDGVELEAWFVPPDPHADGATIIFVHGLGGNRGELLAEATMLVSHGYGALLIDLRNHGRSHGSLTTLGYAEGEDVCGAVDYLLTRSEVNPDRIGLLGFSMGAAAVLRAAARIPGIHAVIAESAYSCLRDNIAQGIIAKTGLPPFPFAPLMIWIGEHMTGLHIDQICPIDDVAHMAPRPMLFVHGAQDYTVNATNSVKLYQAANGPKELYLIKQASHTGLALAEPVEFEKRIAGFLDWSLRGVDRRTAPRPTVIQLCALNQ